MNPNEENFYAAINRLKFTSENSIKITVETFERQQEKITALEKQVEEMQKTLEQIAYSTFEGPAQAIRWRDKAHDTLQSLKGETHDPQRT